MSTNSLIPTLLSLALASSAFGCSSGDAVIAPVTLPPPESVEYALIGSGKVAFERLSNAEDASFIIDGGARSLVRTSAGGYGLALSPDGGRIASTRFTDPNSQFDIYVANIDGGESQQLSQLPGQEGPPTWTPDGLHLVMIAGPNYPRDVYSVSALAGHDTALRFTNLPAPPPDSACPAISGNSERVSLSPQGILALPCDDEIDLVSPSGVVSRVRPGLPSDPSRGLTAHSPSWSQNGARLAFLDQTQDSLAVKLIDVGSGQITTVVTVPSGYNHGNSLWNGPNNLSLCWIAGDARIAFNVPETSLIGHIWVVNVDGSGLAQLTSAPGVYDRSVSCSR